MSGVDLRHQIVRWILGTAALSVARIFWVGVSMRIWNEMVDCTLLLQRDVILNRTKVLVSIVNEREVVNAWLCCFALFFFL